MIPAGLETYEGEGLAVLIGVALGALLPPLNICAANFQPHGEPCFNLLLNWDGAQSWARARARARALGLTQHTAPDPACGSRAVVSNLFR